LGVESRTAKGMTERILKGFPKDMTLGPLTKALDVYTTPKAIQLMRTLDQPTISLGLRSSPGGLLKYQPLADRSGKPLTVYRIESAQGKGPIAQDLKGTRGKESYFTTDPMYVRSFTYEPGNDRVIEAQLSVKPGQVLDARPDAHNDPVTFQRLTEAIDSEAQLVDLPAPQWDFLSKSIKEVQAGDRSVQDLLRDTNAMFPGRLPEIKQRAGISVVLQHADDGLNPNGSTEVVLTDPTAMRGVNIYTPQEFKQAFSDQANYNVYPSLAAQMTRKRQRAHGGLP